MIPSNNSYKLNSIGALLGVLALAVAALAQDPVKVGPNIYKLNFENDFVRVCDVAFKPGEKIGMHSHPDHLVYVQSAGKLRLSYPDGKSKDLDLKAGEVLWIPAESHAGENAGTTELRAVVIELKDAGKPLDKAPPGDDAVKVAGETTKVLLDNARVRVLEANFKPGAKLPMHSHPSGLLYALSDVKYKSTTPDGKSVDKDLAAGKCAWSDPVAHAVENTGKSDAHLLHVEFKPTTPQPGDKDKEKDKDRQPDEKKGDKPGEKKP